MNTTPRITVFYDGSCPMCSAEIHGLKKLDARNQIGLLDCSPPDFDDTPYRMHGIDRAAMMDALHVLDANGAWHKGVDAFALLYRTAGLPLAASLWNHPLTRPFTARLYPWVARNRQALGRLGLTRAMELLGKFYAIRAHRNSRHCAKGRCLLPR